MKAPGRKSWFSTLWPFGGGTSTTSSYPFPPGSQNRDGFERNADNPLRWMLPSTEHRALMRSTVMACVQLIAGTISTLPCNVYRRRNPGPGRDLDAEHPLYGLLHDSPNDDMTAQSFWQAVVASMLLNGEAYGEIKMTEGTKRVVSIEYLDFNSVSWRIENGDRIYSRRTANGGQKDIPAENLFRVLGFSLDGINGISAIRYGAMMLNSAELADAAANSFFRKGLHPTVAFTYDKVMRQDQRDEMRGAVRKLGGAVNAGDPIVLEGGMGVESIGINPDDAQLLESRQWSVQEICRWFLVPPFMVGHSEGSTSWGSGLEQQNLGFLTYCLRPKIKALEQSASKYLMGPVERKQVYVEFAIDALLRADSTGRAALYSSASQNGWMTRAEIREYENLPPVDGSDALTCQSNLVPLDQLGAQSSPANDLQKSLRNFLEIVNDGPDARKT
jgi:HK97 family phage portal protein